MSCLSDSTPVAKKDHTCTLCGLTIPKGERYAKWSGVSHGEFWASKAHTECLKLTGDWDETDWESFDPADFREHLKESRENTS